MRTKIIRTILYFLYLMTVLVVVDFLFFKNYVGNLKRLRPQSEFADAESLELTKATPEIWNSVGYLETKKNQPSRYFHFPMKKASGVIRIGAFGDSFTAGQEVDDDKDYPSLLQKIFAEKGIKNVEVLNFGNRWHGFHQAYRLWEQLGQQYHLDFILLGPKISYTQRDSRFAHGIFESPYYLHGRYVLEPNGDLRFVDIVGKINFDDRFDHYYSFIPSLHYLRYDANPPAFLQALLPAERTIKNPFYYRSDSLEDEITLIREKLLRKMNQSESQVLMIDSNSAITDAGLKAGVVTANIENDEFPNMRFVHNSAMGYDQVAHIYYEMLTGNKKIQIQSLKIQDQVDSRPSQEMPEFTHAWIMIGDKKAAELSLPTPKDHIDEESQVVSQKETGAHFFLALKSDSESVLNADWLGLEKRLQGGEPVVLKYKKDGEWKTVDLGHVQKLNAGLDFGFVSLPKENFDAKEFYLSIAGEKIPLHEKSYRFRPGKSTFFSIESLRGTVSVKMILRIDDKEKEYVIGTAKLVDQSYDYNSDQLKKTVAIKHGQPLATMKLSR